MQPNFMASVQVTVIVVCGLAIVAGIAAMYISNRKDREQRRAMREALTGSTCAKCTSVATSGYVFNELSFVGIVPVAYSWKLTPEMLALCEEHARSQCWLRCVRTTLLGIWGFPGFIAAPLYVVGNLLALHRTRALDRGFLIKVIYYCFVLPVAVVGIIIVLVSKWMSS